MNVQFCKYSATGNTFLAFDNRKNNLLKGDPKFWESVANDNCVDGILFLEISKIGHFKMTYLNADGIEAEMCGNGLRAITHFANSFVKIEKTNRFKIQTKNGFYLSTILEDGRISVGMSELRDVGLIDISFINKGSRSLYLDTGVPHAVFEYEGNVEDIDLMKIGATICNLPVFKNGTNVNFFQILNKRKIKGRTYERGVFRETLSCGTGAIAMAYTYSFFNQYKEEIEIEFPGGVLSVFQGTGQNVWNLCGEVHKINEGVLEI